MVLRILGLCTVFTTFGCVAQAGNGHVVEETRHVSDFTSIDNDSPFEVDINQGDDLEVRVRIDSNLQRYVEAHVHGDTLLIEASAWVVDLPPGPHVTITLPKIENLENHGSGDVFAASFEQDKEIQLRLSGSGNLTLDANAPRISAAVRGSGDMFLSGSTDYAELELYGSGDLDAVDLVAMQADISVDGSGDVRARVEGPVDARTEGSGDIELSGDLDKGNFSEHGSGRIHVR
jgi:Putative auto-transporter adhesin, head GIN domain